MESKACTKCKEIKILADFGKSKTIKSGFNARCRACRNQESSAWRQANREHYLAGVRRWRQENRNKEQLSNQNYKKKHRKRISETERKRNLQRKFHITIEKYNEMFASQNGLCQICKRDQRQFKRKLAVDHCHATGVVRGLLCDACNVAVGMFQDSATVIRSAAEYVERFS